MANEDKKDFNAMLLDNKDMPMNTSSRRTNSSPIFTSGVLHTGQTLSSSERSRYSLVTGISLKRSAFDVLDFSFLAGRADHLE